ncbi:MAG: hypothetical protein OEW42_16070 [Acidimicrobiia bacterium]|nr:hypothetical protein [Acidimicrobiia bacterium]MDH5237079.1 hypothetical protein [Acidimicrobiia bacterium]
MLKLYVGLMTRLHSEDRGAVAGEYAVLLAVIAVVLVAALVTFRTAIEGALQDAADVINP